MNKIIITFIGGMQIGEKIEFYTYSSFPNTTPFLRRETAVATRVNPGETSTGATASQQATNFYNAFILDFAGTELVATQNDTVVTIKTINGSPIFSALTTSANVILEIVNIIDTVQDFRTRSPYLLVSTGATPTELTTSEFTIKQYSGSINDYLTAATSYVKTKSKITPFQNNIWINLSNLVKEDLEADITYYVDNDYTVAKEISDSEGKFVFIETVNKYLNTGVTTGDTVYFVSDGYIEPTEVQGLPNVMKTGNKRYIARTSNERIYFKTYDLTGATYNTTSTGTVAIDFTGDTETSNGYVKSIKVNVPFSDNVITYTFGYENQSPITIVYNVYDECIYDTYDLVFKNKYGFLETISLSKKSSKTLNVNGSDYLRSIVDLEGNYDTRYHTKKQFNVGGYEELTLNTPYIPEYMNEPIKEAMLTEEMWLIENNGNVLPVVKLDQSISFKTKTNDKLIQYTIKVKLSHDTVQNII